MTLRTSTLTLVDGRPDGPGVRGFPSFVVPGLLRRVRRTRPGLRRRPGVRVESKNGALRPLWSISGFRVVDPFLCQGVLHTTGVNGGSVNVLNDETPTPLVTPFSRGRDPSLGRNSRMVPVELKRTGP